MAEFNQKTVGEASEGDTGKFKGLMHHKATGYGIFIHLLIYFEIVN